MTEQDKKGKLVIISGFSGVGKGTVVKKLLRDFEHYALSVSMTTRKPRKGEVDGVHYHFATNDMFEKMIKEDGLLEYAGYVDHYYGTPKAFVIDNRENGTDVILEIEVNGALQIKEKFPEAIMIFVTTPTAMEMEKRLIGRKTETPEQITGRFVRALEEAEHMKDYDYVVINDKLDHCVNELEYIISEEPEDGPRYDRIFKEKFVEDLKEIISRRTEKDRNPETDCTTESKV